MVNKLGVTLCGIPLDNPVMASSGTFGYGREFAELWDLNLLGSFSIKGTTLEPRFGNDTPRIAECTAGLINSIGLQNPGVKAVAEVELPWLATVMHKPVVANVGGFSTEEYVEACRVLNDCPNVGWLEVNISCPNVKGGVSCGSFPDTAAEVTAAVKQATTKPVFIKLSPNVTDIVAIAKACEDAGADGISLINCLFGMRIDLKTRKPIISRVVGGFSGPAIFPAALRMVYQVASAVKIPVMGIGGVSSARDVIEMMMAGATAVQVGAENLRDPYICPKIIEQLPKEMEALGIDRLEDIIGVAQQR